MEMMMKHCCRSVLYTLNEKSTKHCLDFVDSFTLLELKADLETVHDCLCAKHSRHVFSRLQY